jgi:CIC family chloride channel protein
MILNELDLVKLIEKDIYPVGPKGNLKNLLDVVAISKRNIFPVVNEEQILLGIILLDDIREFMFDRSQYEVVKIKDLMHVPPAYIHVGDSMVKVMEHFDKSGAWNLPVIKQGKYMGFISKSSVLSNYRERLNLQNKISTVFD